MTNPKERLVKIYKENLAKVRQISMLEGAVGIAGAVMEIANTKGITAAQKIVRIKNICEPCLKTKEKTK